MSVWLIALLVWLLPAVLLGLVLALSVARQDLKNKAASGSALAEPRGAAHLSD